MWRPDFFRCARWLTLAVSLSSVLVAHGQGDHPLASAHQGPITGPLLSSYPAVDPGEILFGELNCAACHNAAAASPRLNSRIGPSLSAVGNRLTPQYLRSLIANPSNEKPGTTMPDLLHGLPASEKQETVDALVHYLVSLKQNDPVQNVAAESFRIQQGKELYHQVGCVACHSPQEPAAGGDGTTVRFISAPFPNLARATTVPELAAFLMDPSKVRPSGRMPSLNLSSAEATAIAMYLLRDQAASHGGKPAQLVQGVAYQYYEGDFSDPSKLSGGSPVTTGVVDHFTIAPHKRGDNFGFRFTGSLEIPTTGSYTFYSESDDGSRVAIDGKTIVENWGVHPATEKRGVTTLTAGSHSIEVLYFDGGGETSLKVSWQGPNIPKQEIPATVLSHSGEAMHPLDEESFVLDPAKAARGKELFAKLQCAACHDDGSGMHPGKQKNLDSIAQNGGCLAETVPAGLPDYHLDPAQRATLTASLATKAQWTTALEPAEQVTRTMLQLNCFACHTRDGKGGPTEGRLAYYKVVGEADLGDEGRIPPHLTKIGAKLKPDWISTVLAGKGSVRPYMATRMPTFNSAQVQALPALFEKADSTAQAEAENAGSDRDAKFGRRLVGTGGLSCISCHTFSGHKSLGIPAIDLTRMTERLNQNWFDRYVVDPPSLRPGTRMPSFWPQGKAVNQDILGGNTGNQIHAIWAYLAKGASADLPPGLVQGRMELIADKEPVIYRNFIQGAGSRAIGVGYPEHVNLAFDANEVRLAMIWQGPFIDAARHRTGRGEGYEPPLGDRVTPLPSGPSFAVLNDVQQPWPTEAGKAAGYQMRGYQLNSARRPAFHYSWNGVAINDDPIPIQGELDASFKREITIHGTVPLNSWFRAATGTKITQQNGAYLIDGKLTVKIQSNQAPTLRESGGHTELLVPISAADGQAKIVEELVW
jgi:cytochrome c